MGESLVKPRYRKSFLSLNEVAGAIRLRLYVVVVQNIQPENLCTGRYSLHWRRQEKVDTELPLSTSIKKNGFKTLSQSFNMKGSLYRGNANPSSSR